MKHSDLHNYPDNAPPSSGDVYALVLTDVLKAQAFNQQYPRVQIGNYPPDFLAQLFDELDEIKTNLIFNQNIGGNSAYEMPWPIS